MRPTFMGLETARRGLMVTQKAMDIVGHNMSNLETKGYTRQRLDTVSMRLYGGHTYGSAIAMAGQGVGAAGVAQMRNSYLDQKFREEYSDVGYYDQKAAIMEQLESIISDPEVDGDGIQAALSELSKTLSSFSSEASQATSANIVMNAFKDVITVLNQYDAGMKNMVEQVKKDMAATVDDFNSTLEQISELNKVIQKEVFNNADFDGVTYGPNELLDDRNVLLDDLARYGKVSVESHSDGTIDVLVNGHKVVTADNPDYRTDKLAVNKDGTGLFWMSTGQMAGLGKGALAGFQEILSGNNAGSQGIPYYQEQLDLFAKSLYETFNNIVHADDPADPATFKQLLKGGADGIVTAGNLSISDEWLADPSYLIRKNNPNGAGNSDDINAMKDALTKDFTIGGFTGSFSEFIANLTSTLGSDMKNNGTRLDAALAVAETAEKSRMSVSGVSLNEEGINMMSLNKTFQALGRLMTTMDEQLDVIINQMGLVGR